MQLYEEGGYIKWLKIDTIELNPDLSYLRSESFGWELCIEQRNAQCYAGQRTQKKPVRDWLS